MRYAFGRMSRNTVMTTKKFTLIATTAVIVSGAAGFRIMSPRAAATRPVTPVSCDLSQYKASPGLLATIDENLLSVSWTGQRGTEVRARYLVENGKPKVRDLAVRKAGSAWTILGQNLTPEFKVTSGIRRFSTQQAQPLRDAGVVLTPEVIAKNRWYAFWDSPLVMPNGPEMREAAAYNVPRAVPDPYSAPAPRGVAAPAQPPPAGTAGRARGFDPGGGLPMLPLAGRNIGEPRSESDIKRAA